MHDATGTPLQKGDRVLIEAEITDLYATEDFCNVNLRTVLGRRPDGMHESIGGINTAVLVKLSSAPVAQAEPAPQHEQTEATDVAADVVDDGA